MKKILFVGLFFALTNFCFGQEVGAILNEAYKIEAALHEKEALEKFKEVLKYQPKNLQALVKISELYSRISKREANKKIRDEQINLAKKYAKEAIVVNNKSSDACAVMAIALGRESMYKSGKEKVVAVKEIKKYCEQSIQFNPNNAIAWHITGKFNYELSNLNGIERAAAKIFFGGLPASSIKDAIAAYEKAKQIDGTFILNYLELARAYKKNGEKHKARQMLLILKLLNNKTEDDENIKAEADKMLKSLD